MDSGGERAWECGSSMNQRVANAKAKTRILTCAKYNRYGVAHCSQHRLELDTLYQIVLEQIRTCAALALADEAKVMEELRKSGQCDSDGERTRMKAKLSENENRLTELNMLVSKLYKDWIAGRINEANFTRMMGKAQSEQEALQKKADMMRERLEGAAKEQEDNSKWLSLIRQYADIKELDREMLHLLIKEIWFGVGVAFMFDGYLRLDYNMLNKTADKEGHSFPFRRNRLTATLSKPPGLYQRQGGLFTVFFDVCSPMGM